MSRQVRNRCRLCGEYAKSQHSCKVKKQAIPPVVNGSASIMDASSSFAAPSLIDTVFSLFRKKMPAAPEQLDLFPSLPASRPSSSAAGEDEPAETPDSRDVWRRAEEEGLLPLFASPKEILAKFEPLPGDRTRPGEVLPLIGDRLLWRRKLREARVAVIGRAPLYDRVKAEGVTTAVCLQWTAGGYRGIRSVVNGHHRLAILGEENPHDPIPVAFFPTLSEAFDFEEEPTEQWKESLRRNPVTWF